MYNERKVNFYFEEISGVKGISYVYEISILITIALQPEYQHEQCLVIVKSCRKLW